jgi:alkylresorcinol/alkylpyrone synthase
LRLHRLQRSDYWRNDGGELDPSARIRDEAICALVGISSRVDVTDPLQRDVLRFEQREGMLRNILTREVPGRAAESGQRVLDEVLPRIGFTRDDIAAWIWHSGGRKVLEALQRQIGLDAGQLRWSADVLRELGNVSSACVYFVLEAALRGGAAPGWWWMSSFGAGFTCHGALLEVRAA